LLCRTPEQGRENRHPENNLPNPRSAPTSSACTLSGTHPTIPHSVCNVHPNFIITQIISTEGGALLPPNGEIRLSAQPSPNHRGLAVAFAVILNAVKDPEEFYRPQPLGPFSPHIPVRCSSSYSNTLFTIKNRHFDLERSRTGGVLTPQRRNPLLHPSRIPANAAQLPLPVLKIRANPC
jgi:hypothetical protein